MLPIKNVSKKYSNNFTALSNFNLELEGGVIGLLGASSILLSTLEVATTFAQRHIIT